MAVFLGALRICIFNFRTPLARRRQLPLLSHTWKSQLGKFSKPTPSIVNVILIGNARLVHTCGISTFLLSLWYFASRYQGGVEGFGLCLCSEGSWRMDGNLVSKVSKTSRTACYLPRDKMQQISLSLCNSNHFSR